MNLDQLEIIFFTGKPFKPFDQLMGVLPAASSKALPYHYRPLMTDPNSPISDFYPRDFAIDMNGKRFSWQGVAKLPFIDEERLLAEVSKVEDTLTKEEQRRNSVLADLLFISRSHPLADFVFSFYDCYGHLEGRPRMEVMKKIPPAASDGMNGLIQMCTGEACPSTFRSPVDGLPNITNNQVLTVIYKNPPVHRHIARPPEGVVMPKKSISDADVILQALWHEDNGQRPHIQERPAVSGAISGTLLGDAARRLILNTIQLPKNSTSGATKMLQQSQKAALPSVAAAVGGGQVKPPQQKQQHRPQRPAGPPGYEQGGSSSSIITPLASSPHGLGYVSRGRGVNHNGLLHKPPTFGYAGGEPVVRSQQHHPRPQQSPGAGPLFHQHQQPQKTIARAPLPPMPNGPRFMGRGGHVQHELNQAYHHNNSPGPQVPLNVQARAPQDQFGGGAASSGQQRYVASLQQNRSNNQNLFSALDNRGRGRGGRHTKL